MRLRRSNLCVTMQTCVTGVLLANRVACAVLVDAEPVTQSARSQVLGKTRRNGGGSHQDSRPSCTSHVVVIASGGLPPSTRNECCRAARWVTQRLEESNRRRGEGVSAERIIIRRGLKDMPSSNVGNRNQKQRHIARWLYFTHRGSDEDRGYRMIRSNVQRRRNHM